MWPVSWASPDFGSLPSNRSNKANVQKLLTSIWYGSHPLSWLLWPSSLLFRALAGWRRKAFLAGRRPAYHAPVPVIVVGNLNVGGTGKTPVTLALLQELRQRGWNPGVVSRGYGGEASSYPHRVSATDTAGVVGDEPLMIHLRTGAPVVVDPDRAAAVRELLQPGDVDVVISDDGLQHYPLARTLELVVVDGQRGFGNRHTLPMGPLREPMERLAEVDALLVNGPGTHVSLKQLSQWSVPQFTLSLNAGPPVALNSESEAALDAALQGQVYAVAGIGHPQRFFATLAQMNIAHEPVVFDDHHDYTELDLEPYEEGFILTTEKDAVKLRALRHLKAAYVPVDTQLSGELMDVILARLEHFKQHHRHRY